jgi:hypothetical protein
MLKTNVASSMSAVAGATIVAILMASLTGTIPIVSSATSADAGIMSPGAKADRMPLRTQGTACSDRGWAHYEQRCTFERSKPADEVPTIRIVSVR